LLKVCLTADAAADENESQKREEREEGKKQAEL